MSALTGSGFLTCKAAVFYLTIAYILKAREWSLDCQQATEFWPLGLHLNSPPPSKNAPFPEENLKTQCDVVVKLLDQDLGGRGTQEPHSAAEAHEMTLD